MTASPFYVVGVLACLFSLSACKIIEKADTRFDRLNNTSQDAQLKTRKHTPSLLVTRKSTPFLGKVESSVPANKILPAALERSNAISMYSSTKLSITQIADRITRATGLPTYVDKRELFTRNTAASTDSTLRRVSGGRSSNLLQTDQRTFTPDYEGPLSVFLNIVSNHFDMDWSIEDGTIFFNRFVTTTYVLNVPNSNNTMSVSISGATGQANDGKQTTETSFKTEFWSEINDTMQAMVPEGATYSVSPSSGTITVSASPRATKNIGQYVSQINKLLKIRIAIEVAAIYIRINDQDDFGLSIDALYKQASSGLTLAQSSLLPTLQQTGSQSIGIFNSNSEFNGTEMMLRAVASQDRLADYRIISVIAQNNTVTPIKLTRQQDYVSSVSVTTTSESGATTAAVETETLDLGLSIHLIPRVVNNDEIQLTLSISSSELTSLEDYSANENQQIQLATIDARQMKNEIIMKSGETLALTGYEQERVVRGDTGIGSADFWYASGSKSGQIEKTRLLLLVTAKILADPQPSKMNLEVVRNAL